MHYMEGYKLLIVSGELGIGLQFECNYSPERGGLGSSLEGVLSVELPRNLDEITIFKLIFALG